MNRILFTLFESGTLLKVVYYYQFHQLLRWCCPPSSKLSCLLLQLTFYKKHNLHFFQWKSTKV